MKTEYDIVIIGGGFFGLSLASDFGKKGQRVAVLEKEASLMSRASLNNQARVHNGYHYPRSLLTAIRSHESYPTFLERYKSSIVGDFEKFYAVSSLRSNITAKQFSLFCQNVGLPCTRASEKVRSLFNLNYVEEIFSTVEVAFDSSKLLSEVLASLDEKFCDVLTSSTASKVVRDGDSLKVHYFANGKSEQITAKQVFNCTYSHLNEVNHNSELPIIPLKNEVTEMAIVKVTDTFKDKGVTIMCGPFFSFMPYPTKKYHSFSHVRYTPHTFNTEGSSNDPFSTEQSASNLLKTKPKSNWEYMKRDSARYLPEVTEFERMDSLWEVKAVLLSSETSDSRPILFKKDWGLKNYHCVLGGKIDNVFDALKYIENEGLV